MDHNDYKQIVQACDNASKVLQEAMEPFRNMVNGIPLSSEFIRLKELFTGQAKSN